MGTQRSNWIREFIKRQIEMTADQPVVVILCLVDGELDGKIFEASLRQWPPPDRLYAGDISPGALGSYVLQGNSGNVYTYRCRIDDDYVRIRGNRLRNTVIIARDKLIGSRE